MTKDESSFQDRRTFIVSSVAGAVALGVSGCDALTQPSDAGNEDEHDDEYQDGGDGGDAKGDADRERSVQWIDVHTHIIRFEPAVTTPEVGRAAADILVERLDRAQVDKAIILAITERLLWVLPSVPGPSRWTLDDIVRQNQLCLAARAQHPNRLEVFVGLDWRGFGQADWSERAVAQVTRAVDEEGASGIKFHIGQATTVIYLNRALGLEDGHQFLSDEALGPVLEALWRLGGVPLIHVGDAFTAAYPEDAPPFEDVNGATYSHLKQLLKTYPTRPFIVAHMGCLAPDMNPYIVMQGVPEDFSTFRTLLDDHPNLYVDTAGINLVPSRVGLSEEGARAARQIFLAYSDRLLFGTDFGPFNKDFPAYEIYREWLTGPLGQTFTNDYYPGLEIWSLGLDGDVLRAVSSGNYIRITSDL